MARAPRLPRVETKHDTSHPQGEHGGEDNQAPGQDTAFPPAY